MESSKEEKQRAKFSESKCTEIINIIGWFQVSLPKNKLERNEDEGRENMTQKKVGKEKDEGKEKKKERRKRNKMKQ